MGKAVFQQLFNRFVWNNEPPALSTPTLQTEERADTFNLENPNTPINGFTVSEILGGGSPSLSGISVSPENSLRLSAVWRCVNILSGIFSYLPSKPFREADDGAMTEARDHSTYRLFTRRPSPFYTKSVYWERSMIHLLLRGNHYAEIIQNNGGEIVRFNLILPREIAEIRMLNGRLWYFITGRPDPIPGDRMIHVPHLGDDPITGKSTITYAREDLGMEMARREAGARFWADGGDVKSLLVSSQKLSPTQEAGMKESFRNKKKEGGAILAPFGVDVKNLGMTPADQEFIMSGNFSVATICRWFGVPIHKLSELERATFNNIEHQAIEFLQDTMAPIVQKYEDEYTTKCYTLESEMTTSLQFDMAAYQKADSVALAEINRSDVQNGLAAPNEIRKKRSQPPLEGGNEAFIQLNMQPLSLARENSVKAAKGSPSNLRQAIRELAELAEADYKQNTNGNH